MASRMWTVLNAGIDNFAKFCKMTVFERKGERVLAVFSDPDCPYCRRLESVAQSTAPFDWQSVRFDLSEVEARSRRAAC